MQSRTADLHSSLNHGVLCFLGLHLFLGIVVETMSCRMEVSVTMSSFTGTTVTEIHQVGLLQKYYFNIHLSIFNCQRMHARITSMFATGEYANVYFACRHLICKYLCCHLLTFAQRCSINQLWLSEHSSHFLLSVVNCQNVHDDLHQCANINSNLHINL